MTSRKRNFSVDSLFSPASSPNQGRGTRGASKASTHRKRRKNILEKLESRQLLAVGPPQLIAVQPNVGELIIDGGTIDASPSTLRLNFDDGQQIDPNTLDAISLSRAGDDGQIGTVDDINVELGDVGLDPAKPNTVLVRFKERLKDDQYRLSIQGYDDPVSGINALTNLEGEPISISDVTSTVAVENTDFRLSLGGLVEAVVPQPIIRRDDGRLTQNRNEILVYFNEDPLFTEEVTDTGEPTKRSAEHPRFYQLLFTNETLRTTDDLVYQPTEVIYDPVTNTARLIFDTDLTELGQPEPQFLPEVGDPDRDPMLAGVPVGGGTFRLRIGEAVDERVDLILKPEEFQVAASVRTDFGEDGLDLKFVSKVLQEAGSGLQVSFTNDQDPSFPAETNVTVALEATPAGGDIIVFYLNSQLGTASADIQSLADAIAANPAVDGLLALDVLGGDVATLLPERIDGAPALQLTAVGDTLSTSLDVGVFDGTQAITNLIISESVDAQPVIYRGIGSDTDPGHDLVNHINSDFGFDRKAGVTTIPYNFKGIYGQSGSTFFLNQISEKEKQRVREAIDLWSRQAGVQFVETVDEGFTFAKGSVENRPGDTDVRNELDVAVRIDPSISDPTSVLPPDSIVIFGLSDPVNPIFNDSDTDYGESFTRRAVAAIGLMLGLEDAPDLVPSNIMAMNPAFIGAGDDQWNGASLDDLEPVFPGNEDIFHARYVHQTDSVDVDLYRFEVAMNDAGREGNLTIETFAERLPDASPLDTSVALYQENQASAITDFGLGDNLRVRFDSLLRGRHGNFSRINFSSSPRVPGDDGLRVFRGVDQSGDPLSNTVVVDLPLGFPAATFTVADLVDVINDDPFASSIFRVSVINGDDTADIVDIDVELFSPVELQGGGLEKLQQNDDYFSEDSRVRAVLGDGIYYVGVSASGNDGYDPAIAGSGYGGRTQGEYQLQITYEPQVSKTDVIRDLDSGLDGVPGTFLDGDNDGLPGGVHNFWFQSRPQQRLMDVISDGSNFTDGQVLTLVSAEGAERRYEFCDNFRTPAFGNIPIFYNTGAGGFPITSRADMALRIRAAINSQTGIVGQSTYTGISIPEAADPTRPVLALLGESRISLSEDFTGLELIGKMVFVDKVSVLDSDGSLEKPFNYINGSGDGGAFGASQPGDVIRILGNGGVDGDITTPADAYSYQIGFGEVNGQVLEDGANLNVPRDVTVMIEAGAALKFRNSFIQVGSSNLLEDRSEAAVQILGTPRFVTISESADVATDPLPQLLLGNGSDGASGFDDGKVILTSTRDRSVDLNSVTSALPVTPGDWGGVIFRDDKDRSEGRLGYEEEGIFLQRVNHADIRYGGSSNVLIDSIQQLVNPVQIMGMMPTVSFNDFYESADAALSATPNSFEEISFQTPYLEPAGSFIADYERIGPDVLGNLLLDNSINGMLIRVSTTVTEPTEVLTVAARLDDTEVVHYLPENLGIIGTPGGNLQGDFVPRMVSVTGRVLSGGQLGPENFGDPDEQYLYRTSFVDAYGFESSPSNEEFGPVVVPFQDAGSAIELTNLPSIASATDGQYVSRRLYRSDDGGVSYQLVARLDGQSENYLDDGSLAGGTLDTGRQAIRGRFDASLVMDDGLILKARGSRIELGHGTQLLAEGTLQNPIVLTSAFDDRHGIGGTVDTNNSSLGADTTDPVVAERGDWAGVYAHPGANISFDNVSLSYAGGISLVEGGFGVGFAPLELHQAEARVTNSIFEFNDDGFADNNQNGLNDEGIAGAGPEGRFGRLSFAPSTIFVRGSQPVIVGNAFIDNRGSTIDINIESMTANLRLDGGRQTGPINRLTSLDDNTGPLIRDNKFFNESSTVEAEKQLSGLEVRAGEISGETTFDDAGIAHLLFDDVIVGNLHSSGGLNLLSRVGNSLVVKFDQSGIVATGQDTLKPGIGGTVHVLGQPGSPVVLTSLEDDSVTSGTQVGGASFGDHDGDGIAFRPLAGDWRGLMFDRDSNDFNMGELLEFESSTVEGPGLNGTVANAQYIGEIAKNSDSGDYVRRLGYTINGYLSSFNDVDTYSFTGSPGTEVWLDVDGTAFGSDLVVEVLDVNGNVLTRSDNSYFEVTGTGQDSVVVFDEELEGVTSSLQSGLLKYSRTNEYGEFEDFGSVSERDPGLHFPLLGDRTDPAARNDYFVRVRSASNDPDDATAGLTRGPYELHLRTKEAQLFPGSVVRHSEISYAEIALHFDGLMAESPMLGEAVEYQEDVPFYAFGPTNNSIQDDLLTNNDVRYREVGDGAQYLGNILDNSKGVLSVAGSLNNPLDVDFYRFDAFTSVEDVLSAMVFDIDYADNFGRPNANISVFFQSDYSKDADYMFLDDPTFANGFGYVSNTKYKRLDDGSKISGFLSPSTNATLVYFGSASNIADDLSSPNGVVDLTERLRGGSASTQDAFIGPVGLGVVDRAGRSGQIKHGTYYVAVSSSGAELGPADPWWWTNEGVVPGAMSSEFAKREPVNSVARLVEDRFEVPSVVSTFESPEIDSDFFNVLDAGFVFADVTAPALEDSDFGLAFGQPQHFDGTTQIPESDTADPTPIPAPFPDFPAPLQESADTATSLDAYPWRLRSNPAIYDVLNQTDVSVEIPNLSFAGDLQRDLADFYSVTITEPSRLIVDVDSGWDVRYGEGGERETDKVNNTRNLDVEMYVLRRLGPGNYQEVVTGLPLAALVNPAVGHVNPGLVVTNSGPGDLEGTEPGSNSFRDPYFAGDVGPGTYVIGVLNQPPSYDNGDPPDLEYGVALLPDGSVTANLTNTADDEWFNDNGTDGSLLDENDYVIHIAAENQVVADIASSRALTFDPRTLAPAEADPASGNKVITSQSIDLRGYAAADRPYLYFNQWFDNSQFAEIEADSVNDAAATDTLFETGLNSPADDFYNGFYILFTEGALQGQSRVISDYDAATKRITVLNPFSSAPADGDEFEIRSGDATFSIQSQDPLGNIFTVGEISLSQVQSSDDDISQKWMQRRIPLAAYAGHTNVQMVVEIKMPAAGFDTGVANELLAIDDLIVGFAERGETVFYAPQSTRFEVPAGLDNVSDAAGKYQLEMRAVDSYITLDNGGGAPAQLVSTIDTNERQTNAVTLVIPDASAIDPGGKLELSDGIRSQTFEFYDSVGGSSSDVDFGNIPVGFDPAGSRGELLRGLRDAINSQTIVFIEAATASGVDETLENTIPLGDTNYDNQTDGRLNLFGARGGTFHDLQSYRDLTPALDAGKVRLNADGIMEFPALLSLGSADVNYERLQSQVLVEHNSIHDAEHIGIWWTPGQRLNDWDYPTAEGSQVLANVGQRRSSLATVYDPATDPFGAGAGFALAGGNNPNYFNFQTTTDDYFWWSDRRDVVWEYGVPVGQSIYGGARNLPATSDSVSGGLAPGVAIQSNVIDAAAYAGIKIDGDAEPWMLQVFDTPDPDSPEVGDGNDIADGWLLIVDAGGTRVIFEFDDKENGPEGVAPGHVPITYRTDNDNHGNGPATETSQLELYQSIAKSINESVLGRGGGVPLVTASIGRALNNPDNIQTGYPESWGPDGDAVPGGAAGFTAQVLSNALYLSGASGVYLSADADVDNPLVLSGALRTTPPEAILGATTFSGNNFSDSLPHATSPQLISKVVNNTIYGMDGLSSANPEFPPILGVEDESLKPNDLFIDAIDTRLGASHNNEYLVQTVIGDNVNLAPTADADIYRVYLKSGDRLTADIDTTSEGPNTFLQILDESSIRAISADGSVAANDGRLATDYLNFTPPAEVPSVSDSAGANGSLFDSFQTGATTTIELLGLPQNGNFLTIDFGGEIMIFEFVAAGQNTQQEGSVPVEFPPGLTTPGEYMNLLSPVMQAEFLARNVLLDVEYEDFSSIVRLVAIEKDPFIDFTATLDGAYYVVVSHSGNETVYGDSYVNRAAVEGGTTGTYTLGMKTYTPRDFVLSNTVATTGPTAIDNLLGVSVTLTLTQDLLPTHPFYNPAAPNQVTLPVGAINLANLSNGDQANPSVSIPGNEAIITNANPPEHLGIHVVIQNVAEVLVNDPNVVLDPVSGRETDQLRNETGLLLSSGSATTVLNNVFVNNHESVVDEATSDPLITGLGDAPGNNNLSQTPNAFGPDHPKPTQAVVVGNVFQDASWRRMQSQDLILSPDPLNRTDSTTASPDFQGTSNVNGGLDDFNVIVDVDQRLLEFPEANNFNPAPGAVVIDASVNSLLERQEVKAVRASVGLPPTNVLAPNRDVTGLLRADHPDYAPPGGLGTFVFKDRGAVDLADFTGPVAVFGFPLDGDADLIDLDPNKSYISLEEGNYRDFKIQLLDTGDESDPFIGSNINHATVLSSNVEKPGANVAIFENSNLLIEGVDYSFDYDRSQNAITLTPTAGVWKNDAVYRIELNNRENAAVMTLPPASLINDGDVLEIVDEDNEKAAFEFDFGFGIKFPEVITLSVEPFGGLSAPINDGEIFTITDAGQATVTFEFNEPGTTILAGNREVVLPSVPEVAAGYDAYLEAIAFNISEAMKTVYEPLMTSPTRVVQTGREVAFAGELGTTAETSRTALQQKARTLALSISPVGVSDGDRFIVTQDGVPYPFEYELDGDGILDGSLLLDMQGVVPGDIPAETRRQIIDHEKLAGKPQLINTDSAGDFVWMDLGVGDQMTIDSGIGISVVGLSRPLQTGDSILFEHPSLVQDGAEGSRELRFQVGAADPQLPLPTDPENVVTIDPWSSTDDISLAVLEAMRLSPNAISDLPDVIGELFPGTGISVGGDSQLSIAVSDPNLIQVSGEPGTLPSSTLTVVADVILKLPEQNTSGVIQDEEMLVVYDDEGEEFVFEFDKEPADGTFIPDALPIIFDGGDTGLSLSQKIADAINNAQGMDLAFPAQAQNGRILFGPIDPDRVNPYGGASTVGLRPGITNAERLEESIKDGDTFTLSQGGESVTYEFNLNVGGGGTTLGNIPINITANATTEELAQRITEALTTQSEGLQLDPIYLGQSAVELNDVSGTQLVVNSNYIVVTGVPGGTVRVPVLENYTAQEIKVELLNTINGPSAAYLDVDARDRGITSDTISLFGGTGYGGVAGLDGGFDVERISLIRDNQGNGLQANRAGDLSAFTILMPGVQLDFGDAPDPLHTQSGRYATLLQSDGARHVVGYGPNLGQKIDAEIDASAGVAATGDDLTLKVISDSSLFTIASGNHPGEIAIQVADPQVHGVDGETLSIFTSSEASTVFEYDIETTLDGAFDDANIAIRPDVGNLTAEGVAAALGEAIVSSGLSFSVTVFGSEVFVDADDEDGVDFTSSVNPTGILNQGVVTPITVTVEGSGVLEAYIDFNLDGDFTDAFEKVISTETADETGASNFFFTGQPSTRTYNITVPENAPVVTEPLETYARFRVSSTLGLTSDGLAETGEVEDYKIRFLPGMPPQYPSDFIDANGDFIPFVYSLDEDTLLTAFDSDGSDLSVEDGLLVDVTDIDTGDVPKIYSEDTTDATGPRQLFRDGFPNQLAGLLTLNSDGTFSFAPEQDFNGTTSFTARVTDESVVNPDLALLNSVPMTVTLEVNPVNDPPELISDPTGSVPPTVVSRNILEDEQQLFTIDATDLSQALIAGKYLPGPASRLVLGSLGSITDNGGSALVAFNSNHGLQLDDLFFVTGSSEAAYNVLHRVSDVLNSTEVVTDVSYISDATGGQAESESVFIGDEIYQPVRIDQAGSRLVLDTLAGITDNGGSAQVAFDSSHEFEAGESFFVADSTVPAYNVLHTVLSVVSATEVVTNVSYTADATGGQAESDSIYVSDLGGNVSVSRDGATVTYTPPLNYNQNVPPNTTDQFTYRVIDRPNQLGVFESGGSTQSLVVDDTIAYVADGTAGLRILDVTNPLDIGELGSFATTGNVRHVVLDGETAYVANGPEGVLVLDISVPGAITELDSAITLGDTRHVALSGNSAYLADGAAGVRVLDISNPSSVVDTGAFAVTDARHIAIDGTNVFVAAGADGILVLDVSDSTSVQLRDSFADGASDSNAVAVVGSIAYVADGAAGLRILDVANPDDIQSLSLFDTTGDAQSITIDGNLAYVGNGLGGLVVLDVTDPANPIQVDRYQTDGFAMSTAVSSDSSRVYVASAEEGLVVVDVASGFVPLVGADLGTVTISFTPVNDLPEVFDDAYSSIQDIPFVIPVTTSMIVDEIANDGSDFVSLSFDEPHDLQIGDSFEISGSDVVAYDGVHTVTSVVDSDTVVTDIAFVSPSATGEVKSLFANDNAGPADEDQTLVLEPLPTYNIQAFVESNSEAGKVQVTFASPTVLQVGDEFAVSGSGLYDGIQTVVAVTSPEVVVIDASFSSFASGGLANLWVTNAGGVVSYDSDSEHLIYEAPSSFNGVDRFTYLAADTGGLQAVGPAEVIINVFGVDDAPIFEGVEGLKDSGGVAVNQITRDEAKIGGAVLVYDLESWFRDPEGTALSYRIGDDSVIDNDAVFSSVPSINGSELTLSLAEFRPGEASFEILAEDGSNETSATIGLTLEDTLDGPLIIGTISPLTANEDETVIADLSTVFFDPDGDPLSYRVVQIRDSLYGPGEGIGPDDDELIQSIELPNDEMTINLQPNQSGNVTVVLEASDNVSLTNDVQYTFELQVASVSDAPVAVDDDYVVSLGSEFAVNNPSVGLLGNDYDVDGDSIELFDTVPEGTSLSGGGIELDTGKGLVVIQSDGTFVYTSDTGIYHRPEALAAISNSNGFMQLETVGNHGFDAADLPIEVAVEGTSSVLGYNTYHTVTQIFNARTLVTDTPYNGGTSVGTWREVETDVFEYNIKDVSNTPSENARVVIRLEASAYQNPQAGLEADVNADGTVSPIDALKIINYIALNGEDLPVSAIGTAPPDYLDTDGNGKVGVNDILFVLTTLGEQIDAGGEGEFAAVQGAASVGVSSSFVAASRSAMPVRIMERVSDNALNTTLDHVLASGFDLSNSSVESVVEGLEKAGSEEDAASEESIDEALTSVLDDIEVNLSAD